MYALSASSARRLDKSGRTYSNRGNTKRKSANSGQLAKYDIEIALDKFVLCSPMPCFGVSISILTCRTRRYVVLFSESWKNEQQL